MVKNPPGNAEDARDLGSIPGSGRSPGGGNDNPLQCSCLENHLDRGAWQATVHGVAKSPRKALRKRSGILTYKKENKIMIIIISI